MDCQLTDSIAGAIAFGGVLHASTDLGGPVPARKDAPVEAVGGVRIGALKHGGWITRAAVRQDGQGASAAPAA
jgi:hypothetical protein